MPDLDIPLVLPDLEWNEETIEEFKNLNIFLTEEQLNSIVENRVKTVSGKCR